MGNEGRMSHSVEESNNESVDRNLSTSAALVNDYVLVPYYKEVRKSEMVKLANMIISGKILKEETDSAEIDFNIESRKVLSGIATGLESKEELRNDPEKKAKIKTALFNFGGQIEKEVV